VERFFVHDSDDPQTQVAVKVTLREGGSWIGVFPSGGYDCPPGIDFEVLHCPDRKSFCVVAGAAGYVVRADLCGERRVACFPVTAVQPVPELGLVVFLDFTGAIAYDATRIAWESPRLAYDELEIVRLQGSMLRLRGRNVPERRTDELTLDLRTGLPVDGFYPADRPWLGRTNLERRT
jgi:hypothetical protein